MTPRSRRPSISSCTSRDATGSRPDVGSSRKTIAGSLSNARASATRWRSPFERLLQRSFARPARLTAASARPIRAFGVGELVQPGEELEVLGHGETQVEAWVLGHHRDPLADVDAVRRVERQTSDAGRARSRGDQGGEHAHGRRLAGAVRAEKAEHLARGDAERDVVDGDPLPEPLRQMLDDQRRRRPTEGVFLPPRDGRHRLRLRLDLVRRRGPPPPRAAGQRATIAYAATMPMTIGMREADVKRTGEHADHERDCCRADKSALQRTGRQPRPTRRRPNHGFVIFPYARLISQIVLNCSNGWRQLSQ